MKHVERSKQLPKARLGSFAGKGCRAAVGDGDARWCAMSLLEGKMLGMLAIADCRPRASDPLSREIRHQMCWYLYF